MTRRSTTAAPKPTTIAEVLDLATIPLYSQTEPNWAGLIGCSRTSAYRLAHRGEIPVVRVGTHVRVKVPAVLAQLAQQPNGGDAA